MCGGGVPGTTGGGRLRRAADRLRAQDGARNVMRVAQVEAGGFHQDAAALFGGDIEAPQHGLREGLLDGALLVGAAADRAETVVRLHQQDLRPAALELDDAAAADLSAVEPQVVRAQAGGQRIDVEEFGIELVDFQPEPAGLLVPIEREIAGKLAHGCGLRSDRGNRRGGLRVEACRHRQAQQH